MHLLVYFYYINCLKSQTILKMLWIKLIYEYVVRVATFFQGVSSIELNAHEDEWLVGINFYMNENDKKGKKKRKW